MRRREFIAGLGGAVAWPTVGRAQQPAIPLIGWLSSRSSGESASVEAAFRLGLRDAGYFEGQNARIALRWGEGHYDRLPRLAADLVDADAKVIVAVAGDIVVRAVQAATSTIPIVFIIGEDPVKVGLVASLNRPGSNVTGVTLFTQALVAKRLELLRNVVGVGLVAVLVNQSFPPAEAQMADAAAAAHLLGQQILFLNATSERDFDPAFAMMAERRAGALMVLPDPFFNTQRDRLAALAREFAVPGIYDSREHVVAGGLISYGSSYIDTYRQGGIYTGRILNGEKPSNLPVWLPTRFELVINLQTANALGLTIPPNLLAIADEVIE